MIKKKFQSNSTNANLFPSIYAINNKKVHDTKKNIINKNLQPDWQGKQKDDFTKQWETFSSDYTSFQTEMNTFYDAICDEITRLENQKNEEHGIIGWCQSQINNLGNFIEKLLHTKEG